MNEEWDIKEAIEGQWLADKEIIDKLIRQRDRYKKALEEIAERPYSGKSVDYRCFEKIAKEALKEEGDE